MASLRIWMQRFFVIDGDLFAGLNVAECIEQHVPVRVFHVGVRLAAMIDVMRAVAAAGAVQAPATVDVTDAQDAPVTAAPRGFEIRDALAGVFGNLLAALERNGGETATAVNGRLADRKSVCEFERHLGSSISRRSF